MCAPVARGGSGGENVEPKGRKSSFNVDYNLTTDAREMQKRRIKTEWTKYKSSAISIFVLIDLHRMRPGPCDAERATERRTVREGGRAEDRRASIRT